MLKLATQDRMGPEWNQLCQTRMDYKHPIELKPKRLVDTIKVDIFAAVTSALCTSPFISIIDKAIFSNASGKEKLVVSLQNGFKQLLTNPVSFAKNPSFLWIWGVYSGTYIVANSTESIFKHRKEDYILPKFITSSVANVSLSLAKDSYFTRAYGNGQARKVPLSSISLYGVRDSSTILASFILPPKVASQLHQKFGLSTKSSTVISQLATPCLMQLGSTPLHLLGMDLYNHKNKSPADRIAFIRKEYWGTVGARMGRIFPAFGIGGLVNSQLRTSFSKQ
jgi:hypothetical protein